MGVTLNGFLQSLTSPSGTLSVTLYLYVNEYADVKTALAIAAVLMLITLVINLAATLAGRKLKKKQ